MLPIHAQALDEEQVVARRPKTVEKIEPRTLSFEYIKGQMFRVIHADGAIGSITPSGNVHLAFYSERFAIPKLVVNEHKDDGTLGRVISEQTISKNTIIREMDVDVVLSPDSIDSLVEWLQRQKKLLVKMQSEPIKPTIVRKKQDVSH